MITSSQHWFSLDQIVKLLLPILVGLAVRFSIGLHPYSGQDRAPMYGDFEAQRHWMEITVNLPISAWYTNSSDNDLEYWGLDYPPLTAFHSWLVGLWSKQVNESWTELHRSRGLTDSDHKLFMRYMVVLADLVCFLPAIMIYFYSTLPSLYSKMQLTPFYSACLALTYPGLILIDHGHFQFNCVSLGLFLIALISFLNQYDLVGSIFFCMALSYKQMELYHALPIFFYLLGRCLFGFASFRQGLCHLIKLSIIVIVAFALMFAPFSSVLAQVIHRMFPISRGLFEDKVANFWCVTSPLVKWRQWLSASQLLGLCTSLVFLFSLPSCLSLLFRPTKSKLLLSLASVSMTFYLFSFQVHEKSILLVSIPVLCLLPIYPLSSFWFSLSSSLSMWPLWQKDHLCTASLCAIVMFACLGYFMIIRSKSDKGSSKLGSAFLWTKKAMIVSLTAYCLLILSDLLVTPPKQYPDFFALLCSVVSFGHFVGFWIFWNWKVVTA